MGDEYFTNRVDYLDVELWYPRTEGRPKFIQIGMVDVRAEDGLRVSYDFDRDGWVIMQPATPGPAEDCEYEEEEWREVAFIQSWALEGRAGKSIEPVAFMREPDEPRE